MNSRDAAYDDEQLLRAIEASREEGPLDSAEAGLRRAKRGRSDSEEYVDFPKYSDSILIMNRRNQTSVKRQRTTSRSASPATEATGAQGPDDSDDDTSRNGAKKNRSQRTVKDKGEMDEKERQRQEAASKRKNRAERRRAEGTRDACSASDAVLTFARFRAFGRTAFGDHKNVCTQNCRATFCP